MISLIEALNFRCLRHIRQPLDRFHLLVGPNASGKTTFLDVVSFISDFVRDGLDVAVEKRSLGNNFVDLLFGRSGRAFELALEVEVPAAPTSGGRARTVPTVCRYELVVGLDEETEELGVLSESVRIRGGELPSNGNPNGDPHRERLLFPELVRPPETIVLPTRKGIRRALTKSRDGKTNYYAETEEKAGKGWVVNLRLSRQKSALGNLPDDTEKFPTTTWLKAFLAEGIQTILMDGQTLRKPSAPNQRLAFLPDCSNLPWVVNEFRRTHPQRFRDWVNHLKEALPELQDVSTVERPEDRHRYLILEYSGGLRVPSWTASDGTLRLLALTLIAFLPSIDGVVLVEEPENGIHPRAIETMMQSLSNVYDAQVLAATHSPVVLGMVEPSNVLCFSKDEHGATDIVRGDQHPALVDWKHEVSLSDYFVAGVLG